MEDQTKTLDGITPEPSTTEENDGGNSSYSQDDLNTLAGKVRAEEKAKFEKALKDAETKKAEEIQKAKEDAERSAKLTEEERTREALEKSQKEIETERTAIKLERNSLTAERELMKLNLDTDLVEIVLDEDPEKMMEKISKLQAQVKAGISVGVEQALKGQAPKDFGGSQKKTERVIKTTF